ncbi:MAG: lipid-A-disaccharide synthase [Prolixibacteraceae bacterium]|nr:lipid-A-disaccharide synthase [Prolixibacteraceae bacterium]
MKYFLIAGEPSGDMHAAKLMCEIKNIDSDAQFEFLGGDLMQQQGGTMHLHYKKMAFMGIGAVLANLKTIKSNFSICQNALLNFNPHVLILIDYPGFNLRMAKFAKEHNIKTAYYISPKIWAWKTKRVHKIKAFVDQMFTIFPFETAFYQKFNYKANYVGNPVYDSITTELSQKHNHETFCTNNKLSPQKPIVALLAGSRNEEISLLLPVMVKQAKSFPNYQFVIAGAPGQNPHFYQKLTNTEIPVIFDQTYALLRSSKAAIVASGTATLETALLKIPQVVVYKMAMGWFLEKNRKFILKTDFFSLVNLVAEKEVVKELFQSEVNEKLLNVELDKILNNEDYRSRMLTEYNNIAEKLHSEGAAQKTAKAICQWLKN